MLPKFLLQRSKPTYIPLALERIQVDEFPRNSLVFQNRLILVQQSTTELCVLAFRDRVPDIGLFQPIKGDDDAIDFGKRIVEVSFGSSRRELDLLDARKR